MSEGEDMGRRLYEICLSGSVAALDALIEKDQLILNRVNAFACFFSDTPLHVAASCGHLDLTKALLTRKPKLVSELDSLGCSPLHLASIEGHIEIVQELLRVNTDVCLIRDQDGRTPLHLATIKGRVEVIRELLQAKPESILEKLDKRETVLHLCVKYNRLEALKRLVEDLRDNEFLLGSGDDDGNTILHLAATLKQIETIKYLLGVTSVKEHCAKVKNHDGYSALDVVDHCHNRDLKTMEIQKFLLQNGVQRFICEGSDLNPKSPPDDSSPPRCHDCGKNLVKDIAKGIARFWTKYFAVEPFWLKEVRGHLITAATLTATIAYQAILSPPGGVWQDTKEGHTAGEAILNGNSTSMIDYNLLDCDEQTAQFLKLNSVVLFASSCTIMLALSGFSHHNKFLLWLMIFTVYITLSCMLFAYNLAMIWILFPNLIYGSLIVFNGVSYTWVGVVGFVLVLHACHFLVWLGKKTACLVKFCFSGRRRCVTCIPNYC